MYLIKSSASQHINRIIIYLAFLCAFIYAPEGETNKVLVAAWSYLFLQYLMSFNYNKVDIYYESSRHFIDFFIKL